MRPNVFLIKEINIYDLILLLWRWKRAHSYDLTLYDQYDPLTDSLGILSLFR